MKKLLYLYNDNSGKGAAGEHLADVAALFGEAGYAFVARAIVFSENPFAGCDDLDLVVAAGGDGTINYVVNCMKRLGIDLPIGIVPSGTANDFARALGMSSDPLEAARQIVTGVEERIDCGCVNGLYFVNVLSFGIFTTTSQRTSDKTKHRIGKLAYLIEGVKEFRSVHAVPLKVRADGEEFDLNSLMVLVFNGRTAGGFPLARRSSVRDGMFEMVMLEKKNILRSTAAMGNYLLGLHPRIVRSVKARTIDIESTCNEPTDVDGQRGAEFPLHIECLAGALRIVCPTFEPAAAETAGVAGELPLTLCDPLTFPNA